MNNRIERQLICILFAGFILLLTVGCKDNENNAENSNYQWLALLQSRQVWNGTECNQIINLSDKQLSDTVIELNTALYQNQKVSQDCSVDISVLKDSLSKIDSTYANEYKNAVLIPDSVYEFSSDKILIKSGQKKSDPIKLTIHRKMLLDNPIRNDNNETEFILPLQIKNSTFYKINDVVSSLMLHIKLPALDPTMPDNTNPRQEIDGMKLVWHDEFSGTGSPDSHNWNFEHGFVRNQELQWYQDANAVCDGNGALVIEGKKEQVSNPNYQAGSGDWTKNRQFAEYTSSSITTSGKFSFKYGRLLVRAKIPTATGSWPAIWTLGNWWEWPLNGEVDLLEYYPSGNVPSIHANACWGSNTRWSGTWQSVVKPLSDFIAQDSQWSNKYHIWRMDWDKDYIRLYIDDVLINEVNLSNTTNGSGGSGNLEGAYQNPFSNDYDGFGDYILLNLAIGSNGGTPDVNAFPLKYYIDYIRVYQ